MKRLSSLTEGSAEESVQIESCETDLNIKQERKPKSSSMFYSQ